MIGAVEPLVGSVRHGCEPIVGAWLAYALGILAAGAALLPIAAVATWVMKHEQSKESNGLAKMLYRPAALPVFVLFSAILKDIPGVFFEIALYGAIGILIILLAVAVVVQRKKGHAWQWLMAIPIGIGIALLSGLAGGLLSLAFGQRP